MMEIKVCSICKRELFADNFSKSKSGKNGLKAECKECRKQYDKQRYQENKESIDKQKKQYIQENKEAITEYRKQYNQEHKESKAEYHKQYRQEHLEECRVHKQTRRARKRLLPSSLTIQQWESIKEHFNNSCAYCGQELPLAQEHVIPLSKGGEYAISNIICVCGSCNSSKGAKLLNDWYPKQECYSKKREQKILKHLGYKNEIQQLQLII